MILIVINNNKIIYKIIFLKKDNKVRIVNIIDNKKKIGIIHGRNQVQVAAVIKKVITLRDQVDQVTMTID